ncbi:MAG: ribosome-associated translation inhibitor RaiA [Bacteroidota bacterium]
MQITIHKSGDLIESTKQVINDKITKLETYYDRIERADVYIKGDDGNTPDGYKVQVRLAVPGNDLFAEAEDTGIKRGIADVAEALRRQIKKHKEKIQDRDHAAEDLPPVAETDDAEAIYAA